MTAGHSSHQRQELREGGSPTTAKAVLVSAASEFMFSNGNPVDIPRRQVQEFRYRTTQKRAPRVPGGSLWRLPRLILCANPIQTELQIPFAGSASLLSPPRLGRLTWIQPSNATSVICRGWSISKKLSKESMRSGNSRNEQRQDDTAWLEFSVTTAALAGSGRVTANPSPMHFSGWGRFATNRSELVIPASSCGNIKTLVGEGADSRASGLLATSFVGRPFMPAPMWTLQARRPKSSLFQMTPARWLRSSTSNGLLLPVSSLDS